MGSALPAELPLWFGKCTTLAVRHHAFVDGARTVPAVLSNVQVVQPVALLTWLPCHAIRWHLKAPQASSSPVVLQVVQPVPHRQPGAAQLSGRGKLRCTYVQLLCSSL